MRDLYPWVFNPDRSTSSFFPPRKHIITYGFPRVTLLIYEKYCSMEPIAANRTFFLLLILLKMI